MTQPRINELDTSKTIPVFYFYRGAAPNDF